MLAAGASAAEPPFSEHQARYRVERGGKPVGFMHANLELDDNGLWYYRLESEATAWAAKLLGISTTESGWLQWTGKSVRPLTYHHVSGEPGRDRYWQHRYDWDAGLSETHTHDGALEIALEPDTVDPLSLRLAASAAIASSAPNLADLEFSVLERDEIENQHYRFVEFQRIEVAGRCLETAVFDRFRKQGSSRNYRAWHAEALDWLPVRIEHRDDGKPITLALDQWQSDQTPLPPPASTCPEIDR